MSTTLSFSYKLRLLVPSSHDYAHCDQEDCHQHDSAQLLQILSGVVRVATPVGYWVVPPGRVAWLPAGSPHAPAVAGPGGAGARVFGPTA
ncbi:AraC family ligand binding domain-containing protein, partial [Klebsiella pneumoniae]|uniref:AraC family ligand binding domain-containing protein n=1 Tax=Klebsiella pneumoniae TaxID=573 RepID=UPI0031347B36